MKSMALAVGQKWLGGGSTLLYTASSLFNWLNTYVDNANSNSGGASEGSIQTPKLPTDQADGNDNTSSDTEAQVSVAADGSPTSELSTSDALLVSNTNSLSRFEGGTDDADDGGDQTTTVTKSEDRVDRVVKWIEENDVSLVKSGIFYLRIAYASKEDGNYDMAMKYFEDARKHPSFERRALIGLAGTNREAGQKGKQPFS
jgi:hypothetical protein